MRWLLRKTLCLSALGLLLSVSLTQASEPPVLATPIVVSSPVTMHDMSGQTMEFPCDDAKPRHRILNAFRSKMHKDDSAPPKGCYAHHDDYTCGSLRSELVFLFGSCRQFYGQKCVKGHPTSPVPGFDPVNLTYTPGATIAPSSGGCKTCR